MYTYISLYIYIDLSISIYHACVLSHFSCVHSLQPPGLYSLSGFSVHGILQERILEWVAMPFSRGYSQTRDGTRASYVTCIGRRVIYH